MSSEVVTITVRMSPEEHTILKCAAEYDKRSINAFVVQAFMQKSKQILRKAIKEAEED